MIKDKLKLLPFQLFWCATSFVLPFVALSTFMDVKIMYSLLISFYIYLSDVTQSCNNEYLENRIKKLEEDKK